MVLFETVFFNKDSEENELSSFKSFDLRELIAKLPRPQLTCMRNKKLFDWVSENGRGKRILNLGSGNGLFDCYLDEHIEFINLDIAHGKKNLHLIADAHLIPFSDNSFDIVYSIAVLEHVKKPWIVAGEITRILRPGGHVVLELPFLNVIHDEHDYFRFTDKGIRSLFDDEKFEVVLEQVGSGGGSFLSVFLLEYFRQFVPTRILKGIWRVVMQWPFSLIKYLDLPIKFSKDLRITANSFSYIGRKL